MYKKNKFHGDGEERLWVQILAGIGIVAVLCAFGAGFYIYMGEKREDAKVDRTTFCKKDGPDSLTAVLIDRTEGINETQAQAIKAMMRKWRDDVPENGAFRVYEVKNDEALPEPVLSVCNPGAWEEGDELTGSERITRARYEEKFAGPIDRMLDDMLRDEKADASPIMEGLQAVTVREFAPLKEGAAKRLFIVSDLMQHTGDFSLYKGAPDIGAFRRTPYGQRVESNLHGVEVTIYRLNSPSAKLTEEAVPFWLDWLMFQGAEIQGQFRVPG